MNLTREQAIAEHRKMWNWLADQYEDGNFVRKSYYLKLAGFKEGIENDCFCCQYDDNCDPEGAGDCSHCPILWNKYSRDSSCVNVGSPFEKYSSLERELCFYNKSFPPKKKELQLLAKYAREIANLPEK